MVDLATIEIDVAVPGAAGSKATIDQLGDAGDAAGKRVSAAFGMAGKSASEASVATLTYAQAIREAKAAHDAGVSSLQDEALLRHEGIIKSTTTDYEMLAVAERAATEAAVAHIAATEGETAALTQEAVATRAASGAIQLKGLNLGRLNMEMGTFIGRLTGTNTAITRLTGQIGGAVAGYGQMIAVMAAVALAISVYDKLTNKSQEAKKAQDELTKSVEKWYEVEQRGIAGARLQQLDAEIKKVNDLRETYDKLRREQAQGAAMGSAVGSVRAGLLADKMVPDIQKSNAVIAAAQADVNKTITAAANQREEIYVHDLANLVKNNQATAAERALALIKLKDYQNQLANTQAAIFKAETTPGGRSASEVKAEFRSRLAGLTKDLEDALYPKQHAPEKPAALSGEENQIIKDLQKQALELEKVERANNKMVNAAADNLKMVGLEGTARELLNNKLDAQEAREKALGETQGVALTETLRAIDATELLNEKRIKAAEVLRHQAEAQQFMNSLPDEVAKIGIRNAAADKKEIDETAKRIRAQQKYVEDMKDIWARGFQKIMTDGTKSFADFFEDVLQLFTHMLDRMQAAGKGDSIGAKLLGLGSAAVAGGFAGYSIGQGANNAAVGALGGAASGAAAGAAYGPWGAAIGGLVGAAGGLFGAAKAHRDAAAAQAAAAMAVRQSVAQMNAQAGTGSALTSTTAQIHQAANDLFNSIDKALPGLKNQAERERLMAQVRADEVILVQKAIEADKNEQKQRQLSLDAREAYAKGLTAEGDAITRQAEKENQLAAARAANWSAEQVTQLQRIQQLEDEQAAAKKAADAAAAAAELATKNRQATEDYQVRLLRAQGRGSEADTMEMLLQQQREYDQAVKDGLDDATKAALQLAQAAEAAAAASAKAQQAQREMDDLQVRALTAQGKTGEADQLRFQLQQQRELEDAAGKSQDYIDKLKEVLALEASARAAGAIAQVGPPTPGVDTYGKMQVGTVTGISAAQADGLLGVNHSMDRHLSSIEDMLRRALFAGEGLGGGFGGNTLVLQINANELNDIASASPSVQALLDRANGRGLTRMRAGAGATRV